MRRDPVWLMFCVFGLVACVACARVALLLGGPVQSPIVVDCHDGTTCPENYSCPPPGGKCEWVGPDPEETGKKVFDASSNHDP